MIRMVHFATMKSLWPLLQMHGISPWHVGRSPAFWRAPKWLRLMVYVAGRQNRQRRRYEKKDPCQAYEVYIAPKARQRRKLKLLKEVTRPRKPQEA